MLTVTDIQRDNSYAELLKATTDSPRTGKKLDKDLVTIDGGLPQGPLKLSMQMSAHLVIQLSSGRGSTMRCTAIKWSSEGTRMTRRSIGPSCFNWFSTKSA